VALRALRAVVDSLGRSARTVEKRTGFTNAQLFLLRQLVHTDTLSVGMLATRARTRPNTVSTIVSRLAADGYVRKTVASDDGRRADVSLTPKARRLLSRAPTPPTETLIGAIDSLSSADAHALATGLRALGRSLGLSIQDPPILFET
jgi:DNA-binding MarR family transcriptional regulator